MMSIKPELSSVFVKMRLKSHKKKGYIRKTPSGWQPTRGVDYQGASINNLFSIELMISGQFSPKPELGTMHAKKIPKPV